MIVSDRSRVRRVASTRSRRASLLVSTRSSSPSRRSVARIRGMPCVVTCSNHCGAAGSESSRSYVASNAAASAAGSGTHKVASHSTSGSPSVLRSSGGSKRRDRKVIRSTGSRAVSSRAISSSRSCRPMTSMPPKHWVVSPAGTIRPQISVPVFSCRLAARSRTSWRSPLRTSRTVKPWPARTASTSYSERSTSSHCPARSRSSSGSRTPRSWRKSANAPPSNSTASVTSGSWHAAVVRAQHWDTPNALYAACQDPLVTDAVLFEGGAFADFLHERGVLLPDDERLLAGQWLLVERSLYEVEAVRAGKGFTVRDVRNGDRHDVRDRAASRQLKTGTLICGRIVPAGDTTQCFGGIEVIGLHERDELIALLDTAPDPVDLITFLSRRFEPPELRNTEGDPLVLCEATLWVPDPAALAAALDATYERDDSDPAAPQWFEHVTTHGMPRIRATLRLEGDELRVDTNSEARLDRVLATLRTLLRSLTIIVEGRQPAHEIGEAMRRAGIPSPTGDETPTNVLDSSDPEVAAMLGQMARQYEQAWLDDSIPALAGQTPREAAADPTRRPDLIRLLDTFPPEQDRPRMMNPDRLRAALGLQ